MQKKLVLDQKPNVIETLFGRRKAVIGMLHCLPLPGSARYQGQGIEEIVAFSVNEARLLVNGGVDGLIVENHGDIPFAKPDDIGPETVAAMTVVAAAVKRAVSCPIGINVLANGAIQALAIAKAASASFIRVNQWANAYIANEGFVEGPAAQATRYRSWLHAREVKIFADVHVKHGAHAITADRSIPELARDVEFFDADAAVATGQRTGDSASLDELEAIGAGTSLPVVVGSGVTPENVGDMFGIADAVIVASYLKHDGLWWNDVDTARLREFMSAADRARS
ncbi:BtpA/SgcQ family protein [Burkholderia gladioli]|jgi:membrane complex biogenesis BtpA family protein|uniref:Membrane complex biogenesis, BtpA family protein n=1 Tax=Burkholderia gladioli TaxID=28095 RepID=A0AAW3ES42_BURGA|nr:BtpA/SgcQ family protein [Burkholderia gladioli]AJW99366.1 membrane complex biogenesis, BtpA family protein [Burkholderia gladioli]ASD79385.1 BtpA family membrane complex biogenesis protein [Burkholderia gladioli pv. gladioli]AWY55374.1 BtpA family membrane complex biogenesis protein [Burkholderia gladioli pv. gladioli]KGC10562.1 membrane complex biogenesis, BtpA family protein [Burkholderia gladioli]MBU9177068.1 BtpA/SgcQ family protein [Burkholderia gladioli]